MDNEVKCEKCTGTNVGNNASGKCNMFVCHPQTLCLSVPRSAETGKWEVEKLVLNVILQSGKWGLKSGSVTIFSIRSKNETPYLMVINCFPPDCRGGPDPT